MTNLTLNIKNLTPAAHTALMENSFRKTYSHNEYVYLQDDEVIGLHVVASGHIRLSYLMEDGTAVIYRILPKGECFGELAVFDRGNQCDMATSLGESVVLTVPIRTFRDLAKRYPEIEAALGHLVADRYRDYVELTRILSLSSLSARLSQSILRLVDKLGTTAVVKGRKVPAIGSIVTQSDLGLMARGARGNVNRTLKEWEQRGWVAVRDREILILDREKLNAVSFNDEP
ncbi:Crp/Fnr family transcriptional regulator [Methyloraptor flagellatus]|jgi:CRP-like cAMP-binding protein|uniref:Crp/Fnr family transcriptional regulator n=1 Tax=Methyloraptor flagellatus TaxID=3162530 RepID=A0AAU7X4D6_9HYPH